MNKKEIEKYLSSLKLEREELLERVKEIEAELNWFQSASKITVVPVTRSDFLSDPCTLCGGEGEYWDYMAGSVPCPACNDRH